MFKTELIIAWRYIKSKRKEKVISAIAAFSLVGIALGVVTLIIVTSVMNGFRKEFTERVIGFNGHIAAYPIIGDNYHETTKEILKINGVVQAVPSVSRQAIISNEKTVRGTSACGISQEDIKNKKLIADNIVRGNLNDFNKEDVIVLGETLAMQNHALIGDNIVMMIPELDETGCGFMPRKKTFRLIATFNSGMHEYDSSVSYINIDMAQKLFKMKGQISTISIFVDNPINIVATKDEIIKKISNKYTITDWQTNNSSFMKAIEIERNVMFIILTLITLVASFNIISCMIMLVKDKEKDIAILRTIGMQRSSITRIFFITGASIGVFGTFIGAFFGVLFSMNIQKIQNIIEFLCGTKVFSPEVYFLTNLPSLLRPIDVITTIFVSLLLSCFATLYPARKASKLNPTEILRYA